MTVTARGTPCLNDSASARSAISFAMASKSMVKCFLSESEIGRDTSALALEAKPSQVESESILRISRLLQPLLQEGFDSRLRCGSLDRVHTGIPARSDLDVGRQAGFVHEPLGISDRPLIERGDPGCECFDEIVQLGIG